MEKIYPLWACWYLLHVGEYACAATHAHSLHSTLKGETCDAKASNMNVSVDMDCKEYAAEEMSVLQTVIVTERRSQHKQKGDTSLVLPDFWFLSPAWNIFPIVEGLLAPVIPPMQWNYDIDQQIARNLEELDRHMNEIFPEVRHLTADVVDGLLNLPLQFAFQLKRYVDSEFERDPLWRKYTETNNFLYVTSSLANPKRIETLTNYLQVLVSSFPRIIDHTIESMMEKKNETIIPQDVAKLKYQQVFHNTTTILELLRNASLFWQQDVKMLANDIRWASRVQCDPSIIKCEYAGSWLFCWGSCMIIGAFLCLIIMREVLLGYGWVVPSRRVDKTHRRWMIASVCSVGFAQAVDSSFLFPGAYDLAVAFGWEPALSGLLDQLDVPTMMVGSFAAWILHFGTSHKVQRRVVIALISLNGVGEVILSYLMISPWLQVTQSVAAPFVVFRLLSGFVQGTVILNQMITTAVCTVFENCMLGTFLLLTMQLGAGFGPLLPAITRVVLQEGWSRNIFLINGIPLLIISYMQLLNGAFLSWAIPVRIDLLHFDNDPKDPETDKSDQESDSGMSNMDATALPDTQRMWMIILNGLNGFLGATFITCNIQALPVELEKEYHMTIDNTGAALSYCSIVSLISVGISQGLRIIYGTWIDKYVGCGYILLGVCGCILLFNFPGDATVFTAISLQCGSALITPALLILGGFDVGYAFAYADDSKWYSKALVSILFTITGPVCSLALGPLSRAILGVPGGRNILAGVIFVCFIWFVVIFVIIRFYLMRPSQEEPEEQHPPPTPHGEENPWTFDDLRKRMFG